MVFKYYFNKIPYMCKLLFLILFVLVTRTCYAQNKSLSSDTLPDIKNVIVTKIGIKKNIDSILNNYADSLNHYAKGELPFFLFNKCFDLQRSLWKGFHEPISLRWAILEKVNNKESLKIILNSHDMKLKLKCAYDKGSKPQIVIPMIEKSFYQLIKKRYMQLIKNGI